MGTDKSRTARRSVALRYDYPGVREQPAAEHTAGAAPLAVYDEALPHVYGYLLSRCGAAAVAEDLTAETFLAAVDAVRGEHPPPIGVPWLVGVARHKLADHWRGQARERRRLRCPRWRGCCTVRCTPPKPCWCAPARPSGARTKERRPAMRDPLEALRRPVEPRSPDPTFARTLRARLERALTLPRGVAVSVTAGTPAETVTPLDRSVTPYLAVTDARAALDWYVEALGAQVLGEPIVMPDGRVGHAELEPRAPG